MSFVEKNFEMLSSIAQAIAEQFGSQCEVVLHDLTRSYDNTIVAIWNGHVTGRKVGDGGTNAGLEILRGSKIPSDMYGYINYTSSGKIVRSTSKYFIENGKAVGSLCINYDITELMRMRSGLDSLIADKSQMASKSEFFDGNVDDLLDNMIKEEIRLLGKDVNEMTKMDKVNIVKKLDERGAFLIKKAAEKVAEYLSITRFTVYNYLNEGTSAAQDEERTS